MFYARPPDFKYCTSNYSGTPSLTPGTAITAGASNADGTAVTVLSALSHDCEYMIVAGDGFAASGVNTNTLLDILVDPAGGSSWTPIINDLVVGFSRRVVTSAQISYKLYHFPLWIKAGTSIGARARTGSGATQAGRVHMTCYGGNDNPATWWCGQAVETIGVTPSTSSGQSHTAGNSGAFSAWTDLGSPLTYPARSLQFGVGGGAQTVMNSLAYLFEFGRASARIGPPIYVTGFTTEDDGYSAQLGPIFKGLDAGVQLQVRGTCSGTAQARDVAAYAIR